MKISFIKLICVSKTKLVFFVILLLLPNKLIYILILKKYDLMLKLKDYNGFIMKKEDYDKAIMMKKQ